ncbi:hypothetical protein [Fervidibacter sp.]|jgi:hypothetical protein
MPREKQRSLSSDERKKLIARMANLGRDFWYQHWKESMSLPEDLPMDDRESVVRYLLLRALLNQQGDTGKVRELIQKLFATFGTDLLLYPNTLEEQFDQVLKVFREVGRERGAELYRVGALGGIKPLSLFLYRIAAFTIFIRNVRDSFYEAVKSKLDEGVRSLWKFLRDDPILDGGWVGNDPKAARMLTNWLAWLFSEVWQETEVDLQETLMIVDGHVGKVFCRTGAVETVVYESERPFVILAKEMRADIEKMVRNVSGVQPMFVDEGAFQIAMQWCFETSPNCPECPIKDLCLAGQGSEEHQRWTAYKKLRRVTGGE